jgi:hypothetical protein
MRLASLRPRHTATPIPASRVAEVFDCEEVNDLRRVGGGGSRVSRFTTAHMMESDRIRRASFSWVFIVKEIAEQCARCAALWTSFAFLSGYL